MSVSSVSSVSSLFLCFRCLAVAQGVLILKMNVAGGQVPDDDVADGGIGDNGDISNISEGVVNKPEIEEGHEVAISIDTLIKDIDAALHCYHILLLQSKKIKKQIGQVRLMNTLKKTKINQLDQQLTAAHGMQMSFMKHIYKFDEDAAGKISKNAEK